MFAEIIAVVLQTILNTVHVLCAWNPATAADKGCTYIYRCARGRSDHSDSIVFKCVGAGCCTGVGLGHRGAIVTGENGRTC
jgi:hypothetical protein